MPRLNHLPRKTALCLLLALACLTAIGYHFKTSVLPAEKPAASALLPLSEAKADSARNSRPEQAAKREAAAAAAYGRLPLSFEENKGQAADNVKFLSRGKGYTLFLTSDGALLSLRKAADGREGKGAVQPAAAPLSSATAASDYELLGMKLVGAKPAPLMTGEERLPGKSNYFRGDSSGWRTNIQTFARVSYQSVYPGIDLIYYGNQERLEYDFVVAPGADPRAIKLWLTGAEKIEIDAQGDLLLNTKSGVVRQHKPVIYQESQGRRQEIPGSYVVENQNLVSFQVGDYDNSKPLVIDPILVYSTYFGGSGTRDVGNSIKVDASGNAYVAGYTTSSDFPLSSPARQAYAGSEDVFVLKLNAAGNAVVYSTYIGGAGSDQCFDLALDASGQAYVTGMTASADFPLANPLQATMLNSTGTAFVTKLATDGGSLLYSTYLGGSAGAVAHGIDVDAQGNAYVVGETRSRDFPLVNALQSARADYQLLRSSNAGGNWTPGLVLNNLMFITSLAFDPSTPSIVYAGTDAGIVKSVDGGVSWTHTSAGQVDSRVNALAIDYSNPSVIYAGTATGVYKSTNAGGNWTAMNQGLTSTIIYSLVIDPSNPSTLYVSTAAGYSGIFKSTNGGASWATLASNFGGYDMSVGQIVIDPTDPLKIYASTRNGVYRTTNGGTSWAASLTSSWITSLAINPSSPSTLYATTISSSSIYKSTDNGISWSLIDTGTNDPLGSLVIDPQNHSTLYAAGSGGEIYKSTDGGAHWTATSTGLQSTDITALAVNPVDTSIVLAATSSATDLFISKLNPTGSALVYSTYLGGREGDWASAIAVDSSGNAYITGGTSSADFPLASPLQASMGSGHDLFVSKLNPAGSALVYSTYLGGTFEEYSQAIDVDAEGNAVVAGYTYSWDYPTANAIQSDCDSCFALYTDAFVTKLNASGSAFVFSTYLGGVDNDEAYDVTTDAAGNIYVAGATSSYDFPLSSALFGRLEDTRDGFVSKLTPSGSSFIYSTFLGGQSSDRALGVAADSSGNTYVTGVTTSLNFPIENGLIKQRSGTSDLYITKLGAAADLSVDMAHSPEPAELGNNLTYTITVTNNGELPAENVTLETILGYPASIVSVSSTKGTCGGTLPLNCTLGTMNKGETVTVTLVVTHTGLFFHLQATARARTSTPDGRLTNNVSAEIIELIGADLTIKNTPSLTLVPAGGRLTYVVTIRNAGTATANNVVITAPIPSQATFVGCSTTTGGQCDGPGGNMVAAFASLGKGQTATATFTVLINSATPVGTTISNTASVTTSNPEFSQTNNSATAVAEVTDAFKPKTNGKILFTSDKDSPTNFELYVMNADGSNPVRLTNSPGADWEGVWSPDGSKIAFVSLRENFQSRIFLMNEDGTGLKQLTTQRGHSPSWSPDGTRIAYSDDSAIYVINVDGTGNTKLVDSNTSILSDPVWSPDGSRILYTDSGFGDIHSMYLDGSVDTKITLDAPIDRHPNWSPDGSKIVFTKSDQGFGSPASIYVMNADGTGQTKLAACPGSCVNPDWSPDGQKIAYASQSATFRAEIYTMDADGTNQLKLTNTGLYNDQPDWQPLVAGNTIQLNQSSYSVNEDASNTPQGFGVLTVDVVRSGTLSQPATVRYLTSDQSGGNECDQVTGKASQRCDYSTAAGTLRFAPGEATKQIQVSIVKDGYQEGNETFFVTLQNPTGASLGTINQATVTIIDSGIVTTGANNPYLSNELFVRMNYLDFLAREPDALGWNPPGGWPSVLNNCGPQQGFLGAPPACDRPHVSHGFFGAPEFINSGFLIYRLYEVGMNRLPRYSEFTLDMASLSRFGLSDEIREQNLQDYLQQFTSKQEFQSRFNNALQPFQAATLIQTLEQTAGVTLPATATTLPGQPPQYGRQELINLRAAGTLTLGQTLKAFVEQKVIYDRYFARGQVTMLYFAYLKRDPDLNDAQLVGWTEWVKVFDNGGVRSDGVVIEPRDIHHLIFGFIYSAEYIKRFGQP